jgi:hypothetical protein
MPNFTRTCCLTLARAFLAIAAAGGLCLQGSAYAQSATATLTIRVADDNDAAIVNADVAVTNVSTNFRRDLTTNSDGYAGLGQLAPGRYLIKVSKNGFQSTEIDNVVLNVNDLRSLRINLRVGEVKSTVQVRAAGSYSESPSVSSVIDHQFVENLPLNGRSFNALIELIPGTVLAVARYIEPGQYSVNGQRQSANYAMVDGVSANVGIGGGPTLDGTANGAVPAVTAFGGTNGLVSEDAIQEFRIQTSTYAPEFGRSPGAQISIITRSGTNQFHGTAFDYLRNEVLDANDWFANRLGLPKVKSRQNDFGGVVGGPLLRDRTFFFFSYEGLRLLLPNIFNINVPTLSNRQAAIPSMKAFLNAFPLPNRMDLGNGLGQFVATGSSPTTLDASSIRIDHQQGNRISLFGRFNYAPSDSSFRGGFGLASQISRAVTVPSTVTVGMQFMTTRLTNDLRGNYSHVRAGAQYVMDDFGGATPFTASAFGLGPAAGRQPAVHIISGLGEVHVGDVAKNYQRQVNIVDHLAFAAGNHQLAFGADYRRLMPISGVREYDFIASFNGINAAISGLAQRVIINSSFGRLYPIFTNFSAYAQDTWRATRRLTLTYGVRWELNPPPHESNGNDAFTVQGLDQPATATLAPQGTPLWKTTYRNFAPRFGISFILNRSVGRELVLRGGVGVFYDTGNGPGSQALFGSNYPHAGFRDLRNVQFPLSESQLAPPVFNAAPPYPPLFIADPKLALPRTYQWNVTAEQSLGSTQSISVAYVAAAGRRLLRKELLHPNAMFTDVYVTRNTATSDYHALQAQFQRRLSSGLQAMASYTWSHSIDIASMESAYSIPSGSLDVRLDRGNSDFDVRHSFAAAVTYDLPGPRASRSLKAVFGGWSVDSILRARSAPPVYVTQRIISGPLFGVLGLTRPNLILGVPLYLYDKTVPGGRIFNPAAFANAPSGQQGTLGKNVLRAFPASQLDFAVRRQFTLFEGLKLQVRGEFFNLLNHPNFAFRDTALVFGRPNFGRSETMLNQNLGFDATGLNARYQLGGPRSIQLVAKLMF